MDKEWPHSRRYNVCWGKGREFVDLVNKQIENGYTPLGGVSVDKNGELKQSFWLPKPKRKTLRQWLLSMLMENENG